MENIMNEKVSVKEKLSYACGDAAANLAWRPLIAFLPIFYTDIFGLPAATVAVLLLITRLSDGVTDVIMGTIADRTETRWGKFRPWLLWTALPFGLLLALTFTTPNLSSGGMLIYAYTTYILLTLAYTANNVPYSALMGVLTGNLLERTKISSFRFFGAYVGGGIALGLANFLIAKLGRGDDQLGYQLSFIIFGILLAGFSLIAFFNTKERIKPPKEQRTNLKLDFKDLITNRPWIIILVIGFLWVTFNSIKQGSVMYYFTHYMGKVELAGLYMVLLIGASIVSTIITPKLTEIFGKKKLFIIVMIATGLFTSLIYFAKASDSVLIFALGMISEVAAGVMPILFFAMLGDVADYSEYKNYRRSTGLVFSAGTFAMKFGGGVAGAVTMAVLSFFGYDGKVVEKTEEVLNGIRMNMSIIPTLFIIVAILIMLIYPLDTGKMIEIEKELKSRREK